VLNQPSTVARLGAASLARPEEASDSVSQSINFFFLIIESGLNLCAPNAKPNNFYIQSFRQNRNLVTEVLKKFSTSQIDSESFGEVFDLIMIQAFGMLLVHYSGTYFGQ
jgi:hypothetical protein